MVRYRPDQIRLYVLVARLPQFLVSFRDIDEYFLDRILRNFPVVRMHIRDAEQVIVILVVQVCNRFSGQDKSRFLKSLLLTGVDIYAHNCCTTRLS